MLKYLLFCILCPLLLLGGCETAPPPKIGISFGVGEATRWPAELGYMVEGAKVLGMRTDVRLNKTDKPKTQTEDCFDLINSGIAVLILVPRDARKADEILAYAKSKNVKVLSYARAVLGENIDFFVGYDTYKIGQTLGLHLVEKVYKGNLAILKGDRNDFNTALLYTGGMKFIQPLVDQGDLKLILDDYVDGWSPAAAKAMLKEAIAKSGGTLDAVFAPNDLLAGAAAEAVQEMGLKNHVVIVGMDAELAAVRRLARGTQEATVYMDLKAMAYTAVNEAYNLAVDKKNSINSKFNNDSDFKIDAYLINGKLITRENLDALLIDSGVYTREQVYGPAAAGNAASPQ